MTVEIGKVFSNAWAILKERWAALLGLWALFFGVMLLFFFVLGSLFANVIAGAMNGLSYDSPFDNASSLGMGFTVIVVFVLVYAIFLMIVFAQQGAMVAKASPLLKLGFGEALRRGVKGSLTYLAIMVIYIIASLIVGLLITLLTLILSFLGDLGKFIVDALVTIGSIYLACRFCVIVPVITVDKVYNPITAINESWRITSPHVLRIFLVLLIAGVAAFLLMLPFAGLIASLELDSVNMGGAISAFITIFSVFGLIYLGFSLFGATLFASLHAETSDNQAAAVSKTFE